MNEKIHERNYGIDLMRIVMMFLICLHHVLDQGGVLNSNVIEDKTIYAFMYVITMIGVDGFALISGYVANIDREQKYEKIIDMWFQVFFYSFGIPLGINLLRLFSTTQIFSISEIIDGLFPILNHKYWYFDAYLVLFFFMPIINKFVANLDKNKCKKMLYLLFALMIIMWKNNEYGSHNYLSTGRSAFWLIILYIVGTIIRKINILGNIKTSILFIVMFVLFSISFIYKRDDIMRLSNIDPSIWLSAIFCLVIFSRFKPNKNIISFISPLAFGVYLFHENYFYKYYLLSERFIDYKYLNTLTGFVRVMSFTMFTFVLGLFADFIRTIIFKKIRIDKLSKNISTKIDSLLEKLPTF